MLSEGAQEKWLNSSLGGGRQELVSQNRSALREVFNDLCSDCQTDSISGAKMLLVSSVTPKEAKSSVFAICSSSEFREHLHFFVFL